MSFLPLFFELGNPSRSRRRFSIYSRSPLLSTLIIVQVPNDRKLDYFRKQRDIAFDFSSMIAKLFNADRRNVDACQLHKNKLTSSFSTSRVVPHELLFHSGWNSFRLHRTYLVDKNKKGNERVWEVLLMRIKFYNILTPIREWYLYTELQF